MCRGRHRVENRVGEVQVTQLLQLGLPIAYSCVNPRKNILKKQNAIGNREGHFFRGTAVRRSDAKNRFRKSSIQQLFCFAQMNSTGKHFLRSTLNALIVRLDVEGLKVAAAF